jgi:hypothetical protein
MRKFNLIIPLIIIYLSAALVLLDFFTDNLVQGAASLLGLWVSIILGFAVLIGLANVLQVHLGRVLGRQAGYGYSAVLLVSAVGVIVAGILGRLANFQDSVMDWVYQYLYQPLAATLFSLLAFLMVAAAAKTLRIGSVESGLLLVGALIVLLGQIAFQPFGGLQELAHWFQNYPVLGVLRGILIGAALGAIATSLRYILGIDNRYLG